MNPFGNRAGTEPDNQVSRLRVLRNQRNQVIRVLHLQNMLLSLPF